MREKITALTDELSALITERAAQGWDKFWRDCMRFALPNDTSYNRVLLSGSIGLVTAIPNQTMASKTTQTLYDQTSVWAVERLTAGLLSLKTPEASHWHGLDIDDPYGMEATREEEAWFDKLARYLFKVRSNPRSGFWPSHKAAVRSTAAMGDGFYFLGEKHGDERLPFGYEFVPLGEVYQTVDMSGQTLRFYRYRTMTAEQIVTRWPDAPKKIVDMANDPKRRQTQVPVAHAIVPRDDVSRNKRIGVLAAPLAGYYFLPDERAILEESGYWEMPYIQHSWNRNPGRAYSEGPLALALAEIKSLNEMSKNELISSQQAVRPPLAVYGENYTRINLNAGQVNKGLVSGDGRLLVQPIMTHTRPDFAQAVLETRRNGVREMLYLNLWQILIENVNMTATEALLRAQEKGDLLGPVGISFNHSLGHMVDREIAILARKGVFEPGQPLAAPASIIDKNIMPYFTAPLDRMRNMDEVIGAQRTVQGMLEVAAFDPTIMEELNVRAYAELLRKGNGGPADLFISDDDRESTRGSEQQKMELAQLLELMQQGGAAAQSIGAGKSALDNAGMTQGPSDAVMRAVAA